MNFHADWFPAPLLLTAAVLWLVLLAATAKPALNALRSSPQSAVLAAAAAGFAWLLRIDIQAGHMAGMDYHFLGLNLVCLMVGAPAAFWIGSAWALLYALLQPEYAMLAALPLNVLAVVLPACLLSVGVRRWGERALPKHLFIYIFIFGFVAAVLGMLLAGTLVTLSLLWAGVFPATVLRESVYPVFFLISWGEGFLNGIFTAVFVSLLPQVLKTFDDARYLGSGPQIWK